MLKINGSIKSATESTMCENVKITILSDNRSIEPFENEHGFAMVIKTDDKKILFDTGQFDALFNNAEKLGVDLSNIDTVVLSHGHYDHSGGMDRVLKTADNSDVFLHSASFLPRYSIHEGKAKPIQMPLKAREAVINYNEENVHWTFSPRNITAEVGVTGTIPRETDYEDAGGPFFLDPKGIEKDIIEDDQAMWIETPKGLVICVGCSHSGIINIINYIIKITGESRIHTLIGGMHLVNAGNQRVDKTIEALNQFDIDHIIPCHCTGDAAIQTLIDKSVSNVKAGHAGMIYKV